MVGAGFQCSIVLVLIPVCCLSLNVGREPWFTLNKQTRRNIVGRQFRCDDIVKALVSLLFPLISRSLDSPPDVGSSLTFIHFLSVESYFIFGGGSLIYTSLLIMCSLHLAFLHQKFSVLAIFDFHKSLLQLRFLPHMYCPCKVHKQGLWPCHIG